MTRHLGIPTLPCPAPRAILGLAAGVAAPLLMQYSDYFVFFGAVSLVLGILGYVRGKSLPSLIAGGISGIGLVAAGILAVKKGQPGFILGLVLSVLLLGRFLPAFLKKKQFYPAGIMAILSLGGVIAGIFALTSAG